MAIRFEEEEAHREPVPLVLPLSHATVRWLAMLSGGSDEVAAQKVAEMLEEICRDDMAAHRNLH